MKSLLREPLVHFVAIGAALFLGYSLFRSGRASDAPSTEIRLTLDDLAQLGVLFESRWRRPPTAEELDALAEDRVREEILYREALALGLDEGDAIVKRRLAQKMRFLAEDLATAREPRDGELRAWFESNADRFVRSPRLSLRHLYFSPDRRGTRAPEDAASALARLAGAPQDDERAGSLADPFMFQDYYADTTPERLAREFGAGFAQAVAELAPGSWQGPVESGLGWHLVFVESATPGQVPSFEEVEPEARSAWLVERREEGWREAYAALRARYTVLVPVLLDDGEPTAPGGARPSEGPAAGGGAPP